MIKFNLKAATKPWFKIDLIPLIDIVFILLVFFAVSTSIASNQGIDLTDPKSSTVIKQSSR